MAVGAPNAPGGGEIYLYSWPEAGGLPVLLKVYSAQSSEQLFGAAVALSGDLMLVGMPGTDQAPASDQGRAALFSLEGMDFAPAFMAGVRSEFETSQAVGAARDNSMRIVPNPVSESFELRSQERVLEMRLYDLSARLIATFQGPVADLNGLTPGLYTLKVQTDSGRVEALRLSVVN
jgi:hypothetical protein